MIDDERAQVVLADRRMSPKAKLATIKMAKGDGVYVSTRMLGILRILGIADRDGHDCTPLGYECARILTEEQAS